MRERWRRIIGFPGYEISSEGRVRSYKSYSGKITDKSHVLRPRVNPNGYAVVTLYDEGHKPCQLSIHRLVAKAFIPTDDDSLYIDHIDNDKLNNSVSNLEWVTPKENSIRAVNDGLCSSSYATNRRPVMVSDIRTGEEEYFRSAKEAARIIGCTPGMISMVANGLRDKVKHYTIEFADREDILLFGEYY